ncbi:unnamed protein product [Ectocarpus sp. 12 AP-2014]
MHTLIVVGSHGVNALWMMLLVTDRKKIGNKNTQYAQTYICVETQTPNATPYSPSSHTYVIMSSETPLKHRQINNQSPATHNPCVYDFCYECILQTSAKLIRSYPGVHQPSARADAS